MAIVLEHLPDQDRQPFSRPITQLILPGIMPEERQPVAGLGAAGEAQISAG
jgi:hypothetical protein